MTQQVGEVTEPFTVLQTKRYSAVAYGPVLALFAEHSFLHDTDARPRIYTSEARSSAARLTWHLKSPRGMSRRISGERKSHYPPRPQRCKPPRRLSGHFSGLTNCVNRAEKGD